GQAPLPSGYEIGPDELKAVLARQRVDIQPGDAVFIRTGILSLWGEAGHDKAKLAPHDSAGINVAAAKWLVEGKGAVLVGADTSASSAWASAGSRGSSIRSTCISSCSRGSTSASSTTSR